MELGKSIIVMCALVCLCSRYSSSLEQIYMNDYCGKSYKVNQAALYIKYITNGAIVESCQFALKTENPDEKFMVRVIQVDMFNDCSDNYAMIQDGDKKGAILLKLCKHDIPEDIVVTSGTWLTLNYSCGNPAPRWPFQLMITKFTNSACDPQTQFTCNNSRCIAKNLTCDGWDNCGDDSDETRVCAVYPTIQMNERCGWIVQIGTPATFLKFFNSDDMIKACKLDLIPGGKLMIVKAMAVDFIVSDCTDAYVTVQNYGGSVMHKFCNSTVPATAYFSGQIALTINYVSGYIHDRFQFLVTKYDNGPCDNSTQFTCDSGRCINNTLHCDGWNNCGDDSDEVRGCKRLVHGYADDHSDDRPKTCDENSEFRCENGQCIDKILRCDGGHNCADNSDEVSGCNGYHH